jgi:hypothetical protein
VGEGLAQRAEYLLGLTPRNPNIENLSAEKLINPQRGPILFLMSAIFACGLVHILNAPQQTCLERPI